jgi:hypothetical protein
MVMMMAMDQRSHLASTLPKSLAPVNAVDHKLPDIADRPGP